MKLEIKTRCAECGGELINSVAGGDFYTVSLCVKLCPHCHPAKAEKVTPKGGELVEVRMKSYPSGNFNMRTATGVRGNKHIETNNLVRSYLCAIWDQWRYPGETEWRD